MHLFKAWWIMGDPPCLFRRHSLTRISWSLSSYNLLPPLPWWFLSLRRRSSVVDGATEAGHLEILCSLNFDKLWFSVMVFVFCKRTLLCWWVRAALTCGCKDKLSSKIRDLTNPGYLTRFSLPGMSSLLLRGLKTNERALGDHQDECP